MDAFEDAELERLIDDVGERLGYAVGGHDIVLRGACPDCVGPVAFHGRAGSRARGLRCGPFHRLPCSSWSCRRPFTRRQALEAGALAAARPSASGPPSPALAARRRARLRARPRRRARAARRPPRAGGWRTTAGAARAAPVRPHGPALGARLARRGPAARPPPRRPLDRAGSRCTRPATTRPDHGSRAGRHRPGLHRRRRRVPAAPARRAARPARALRARAADAPGWPRASAGGCAPAAPRPARRRAIIPRSAWGGDSVPPRAPPIYGEVQLAFVHHTVTANDYAPEDSAGIVLAHRPLPPRLATAGTTSATSSWSTSTGRSSRAAPAASTRPSSARRRRAGTASRPASRASATFTSVAQTPAGHGRARAPDRLEAVRPRRADRRRGDRDVGRRRDQPLPGRARRSRFQRISGHRDGNNTSCPGDLLYTQLEQLRSAAAQYAGPTRRAHGLRARAGARGHADRRVRLAALRRRVVGGRR